MIDLRRIGKAVQVKGQAAGWLLNNQTAMQSELMR